MFRVTIQFPVYSDDPSRAMTGKEIRKFLTRSNATSATSGRADMECYMQGYQLMRFIVVTVSLPPCYQLHGDPPPLLAEIGGGNVFHPLSLSNLPAPIMLPVP